jgi:hypothetical protein
MAARLTALLPRLLALTVIWLLGAATYTLAADTVPTAKHEAKEAPAKPHVLTVPDVRRKAYVFAKGILQDAGFAWRVEGSVKGFAANSVAVQSPSPGTKVIDNGAPVVVLSLTKNSAYGESGLPENSAPYKGTRVVLVSDWTRDQVDTSTDATTTAETTNAAATTEETTTAATTTAPAASTTEPAGTTTEPEQVEKTRKPDFEVPGAPAEPADEISLPARAKALQERLGGRKKPSRHLINFWLYQHSWIVTGARFGWHNGAEALRILIKVDQSLERRFGFGAKSEVVARRALAYVEAQAK